MVAGEVPQGNAHVTGPDCRSVIRLKFNEKLFQNVLIDSGSLVSAINPRMVKLLNSKVLPLQPGDTAFLIAANSSPIKIIGRTVLNFECDGRILEHSFLIIPYLSTNILFGMDILNKYKVVCDFSRGLIIFLNNLKVMCIRKSEFRGVAKLQNSVFLKPHRRVLVPISVPGRGKSLRLRPLCTPLRMLNVVSRVISYNGNSFASIYNKGSKMVFLRKGGPVALVAALSSTQDRLPTVHTVLRHIGDTTIHKNNAKQLQDTVTSDITSASKTNTVISKQTAETKDPRERTYTDLQVEIGDLASPEERKQFEDLITEYSDVFACSDKELTGCKIGVIDFKIKEGAKPVRGPVFRHKLEDREIISQKVQELLEADFIEPSTSPWVCSAFLVKNKAEPRLVYDFRKINQAIEPELYPTPLLSEIIAKISQTKAKVFAVIDLKAAYCQTIVAEDKRKYLSFRTERGQFQWKRGCFGVNIMPAKFQYMMTSLLSKDEYLALHSITFLDDILLFENDVQGMYKLLKTLFQLLREVNFKLHPKKCHLLKKEVEYIGHIFSEGKLKPQTQKISKMLNFKKPDNKQTLKAYLSLLSYYRSFMKNFAAISAPLNELLKKDVKFVWTEKHEQAYNALQDLLQNLPPLAFPDELSTNELRIYTDASNKAIGFMLAEVDDEGKEKLITCYSRLLKQHEANWNTHTKELLALVVCCLKYRHLICTNRKVTIYSDNLTVRFLKELKQTTNLRCIRWAIILDPIISRVEIKHIPGKDNWFADSLSRLESKNPVERLEGEDDFFTDSEDMINVLGEYFDQEHDGDDLDLDFEDFDNLCEYLQDDGSSTESESNIDVYEQLDILTGSRYLTNSCQEIPEIASVDLSQSYNSKLTKIECPCMCYNIVYENDVGSIHSIEKSPNLEAINFVNIFEEISWQTANLLKSGSVQNVVRTNESQEIKTEGLKETAQLGDKQVGDHVSLGVHAITRSATRNQTVMNSPTDVNKLVDSGFFNGNKKHTESVGVSSKLLGESLINGSDEQQLEISDKNKTLFPKNLEENFHDNLAILQRQDHQYASLIKYLESGELPEDIKLRRQVILESDNFYINEQNLLCFKKPNTNKLTRQLYEHFEAKVVPEALVDSVLEAYHKINHSGVNKMIENIGAHFYFKKFHKKIRDFVITCVKCRTGKRGLHSYKETMTSAPKSHAPFSSLNFDILEVNSETKRGNKHIFTCIDSFSGFPFVEPLKDMKSDTIANTLLRIISFCGLPHQLVSDLAPSFCGHVFKQLWAKLGVKQVHVMPYHSSSNRVERMNRIVSEALRTNFSRMELVENWDLNLDFITFGLRTAKTTAYPLSPYTVVFGREPRDPFELLQEDDGLSSDNTVEYVEKLQKRLELIYKIQTEIIERNEQEMTKRYNNKFSNPFPEGYQIGQLVYFYHEPSIQPVSSKFKETYYEDAYQIVEILGSHRVKLKNTRTGFVLKNPTHVSKIYPYYTKQNLEKGTQKGENLDSRQNENRRELPSETDVLKPKNDSVTKTLENVSSGSQRILKQKFLGKDRYFLLESENMEQLWLPECKVPDDLLDLYNSKFTKAGKRRRRRETARD